MARILWPGSTAEGRCLQIGGREAPCTTVVGVAEDARRQELVEGANMQYYVPLAQRDRAAPEAVLIRTLGRPERLEPIVRNELLTHDPRIRFVRVRPFRELIDPSSRSWRLGGSLFSVFGFLALVVAAMGLYSLLAFSVAQRIRELGIRSALGAKRRRLLGMIAGWGVRLAGIGVALGLLASVAAGRFIEPLLFQVSPHDPLTLVVVSLLLLSVAGVAAGLPAWRPGPRVAGSRFLTLRGQLERGFRESRQCIEVGRSSVTVRFRSLRPTSRHSGGSHRGR